MYFSLLFCHVEVANVSIKMEIKGKKDTQVSPESLEPKLVPVHSSWMEEDECRADGFTGF